MKSDGSGSRTIDIAIDKSFAQVMESTPSSEDSKNIEEEMKKNLPKGGKFRKYDKDDKTHYQMNFDFKNIKDLKAKNKKLSDSEEGLAFENIKFDKKDYLILATYSYSEEISQTDEQTSTPESEELTKSFSLEYKLTLPGEITDAKNTDKIKDGTATWNLSFVEGGKISAKSQLIRWWLIIILAVAVFILFLIIIIAIILVIRSRKKKPLEVGGEEVS